MAKKTSKKDPDLVEIIHYGGPMHLEKQLVPLFFVEKKLIQTCFHKGRIAVYEQGDDLGYYFTKFEDKQKHPKSKIDKT